MSGSSPPTRIVEAEPEGFEADLLRAARGYTPPSSAKRHILVGVGLTAGATTAATGSQAAVAAAKALLGGKAGIVLLVLGGALGAGGAYELHARSAAGEGEHPVGLVAAPAPPLAPRIAPSIEPSLAPPVAEPVAVPRAKPARAAPSHAEVVAPIASSAEDTLSEELALLDRARTAQRAGRSSDALAATDEHAKRFPNGRLALQAELVRIESLVGAGRSTEARARAERFISAHPRSVLAARAREILEKIDAGP